MEVREFDWDSSRKGASQLPRTKTIRLSTQKTTTGENLILGYTSPLTQELSAVEQEQDELRHKVQAISDGIGEEFERRHEELRTAEKSLRDDVDNLQWKESKPIELRKEKIVENMRQFQIIIAHHLQANLSDAVLVKASAKQWPQMYVRTPIAVELASAAESPTVTSIHDTRR